MIILMILLTLFGLVMLVRPTVIWKITESWKSKDASEPSTMYMWFTRFGGAMFTIAGIGGIYAYSIL
jgi:hypothetical protein